VSAERRYSRHQIGSTAEFLVEGEYFSGIVVNSSLGGIALELEKNVPSEVFVGSTLDIRLYDIYSDMKYPYPAKVARKSGKELAVEFLQPLTENQEIFLKRWLEWQE